ncbi:exopolysaccharide biosynthesis polyprenyl glycosylphosphotransferase [Kribbella pratensis]|uniref:Exopolysaccharide biosynthesis polyprenyl glycosylphosphotransferase n=1 Tax=Kribbella pratensis TaxID=2512112 RepID=A0ABY2FK15_9ACTN|nr:exopolysaccharide biosynthesis polyprenyl glycosylphosphotransferase [Kribbella pratensis]
MWKRAYGIRARWIWLVFAALGVVAISSRWWAPAVGTYFGADVSTRDQLSSPYGLAVGFASLVVAIVVPILQARQSRALAHELSTGHSAAAAPGFNSLRPPDVTTAAPVYGRDYLLEALVDLYSWRNRAGPRTRVLSGMPGCGKTAIALRVANRVTQRGVQVWWISAADEAGLQTGLRQLAQLLAGELDVPAHDLDRQWTTDAPDVLWRLLNAYRGSPWMLVIDNADDIDALAPPGELPAGGRGWLRPVMSRRGAVLVTTRDRRPHVWSSWTQLEEIEELPPGVGARLLLRAAGDSAGSHEEAAALSERLGGLPLALTVVGRHLSEAISVPLPGGITTFAGYRAALDSEPLANPAARGVMNRAFALSIRQLEDRGYTNARILLRLLSVLADAPLPYFLILDPAAMWESSLFKDIDVQKLRGLLQALSGQSLLELSSDTRDSQPAWSVSTLRLHPLLRDANLHAIDREQQTGELLRIASKLLDLATGRMDHQVSERSAWPTWQALAPHTMHVLMELTRSESIEMQSLTHAARAALRATDYLAATGLASASLTQARTIESAIAALDSKSAVLLSARAKVAELLGQGGEIQAALDQFTVLVPIFGRVLGEEHPETLTCRANLADYVGRAGEPGDARDRFAVLVPTFGRVLGEEHPETLTCRANLAYFTAQMGESDAASDLYRQLLPIQERILGEDHPATMRTVARLATLLAPEGEQTKSQEIPARERPIWVVPEEVPAVVPLSRRRVEPRWISIYRWTALGGDLIAALIGVCIPFIVQLSPQPYAVRLLVAGLLPLIWVAAIGVAKGYQSRLFGTGPEEFRSVLLAGVGVLAILAVTAYTSRSDVAHGFVELSVPAMMFMSLILRYSLHLDLSRRRYQGRRMRRVLVVGHESQVTLLRRYLEARPADGYLVVAACHPRGEPASRRSLAGLSGSRGDDDSDVIAAVDRCAAEVVVVAADPELGAQSLRRISWALEQRGVELIVSPGIVEVAGPRISIRPVAGMSLLHLERPSVSGGPLFLKSVFDRIVAALMLVVLLPLILVVALVVRFSSRGPTFYRDTRIGFAGQAFSMVKFRTMYVDAGRRLGRDHAPSENSVLFKLREDPRITLVGRVLRRYSIDELPQLLNVLRGEMSMVGPRPPRPEEAAIYGTDVNRRLLVKPGLTGLWQVSGRSDLSWEESVNLDLRYVDNWSLVLDLLIMWKTLRAVIGNDGAY